MPDEQLVVVCGLPGVGKTTVAEGIAGWLEADLLRTDVVRADVVAEPAYTPEERQRVYDELCSRARERLGDGHSVVLDGTFARRTWREQTAALARETDSQHRLVVVECAEPIARERLRDRDGDESDADPEVYDELKANFEPVEHADHRIDNGGSVERTLGRLDDMF
jgi:predicted kinase